MQIKKLDTLIPRNRFVGTSLILSRDDRFLYGIRPVKTDGGRKILELTGIGGGMEAEDASYIAGARREAMEEIGCPVSIVPSDETLVVWNEDQIEEVMIVGPERPLAIVFRNHRTPAHHPWHPTKTDSACLLVFEGALEGRPTPSAELPHLVWLTAEQIQKTARHDVPLSDLLADGGTLVSGRYGPPPEEGWTRLTDSQEALALALGDKARDFYLSLIDEP